MSKYIIGIDEAGRGAIAGPVSVGLVMVLKKDKDILKNYKDSKQLTEKKREELFVEIQKLKREGKLFYTNSLISSKVIDSKGIVFAINSGIKKCLEKVGGGDLEILLDGSLKAPDKYLNQKTIIKGDQKIKIIGSASIVAKVSRDRFMVKLSNQYSGYGFEKHKGYGTKEHYKAIGELGQISEHRRSYLGS